MSALGLDQIGSFLTAAVLLTLAPGPDNLLVLALGMSRGRQAGLAFGLGCAAGCLSHTLLAALGIATLIASSPLAFGLLKLAGGGYLLWLAWQIGRSPAGPAKLPALPAIQENAALFRRGLLANAINPKVVIFFLAFLPPFVEPAKGNMPGQLIQLGLLFAIQAAILFSLIAYFAGSIGHRLKRSPQLASRLDRVSAVIFGLLAIHLIFY